MRITTLGDLLLDVIVQLDRPLVPGDDQVAVTRTGAGGQAANVAAWARALGADARLVAKRGADAAGDLVTRELEERGVEVVGPVAGRNGVVVSLASAGDRTMASDRGAAPELLPQELEENWFDCDVLHLSGYSLHREPIATASVRAAELARAHGARVSLDLATWTLSDDAFRRHVATLRPDVLFGNDRELAAAGSAVEAAGELVRKRGAEGIVVDGVAHAPRAGTVVDPTGAGDALAAGYLVGGPELALETAARCCARLGTLP